MEHNVEPRHRTFIAEINQADLIVNCTSVGLWPNEKESPIQGFEWANQHKVCCDIIYKPKEQSREQKKLCQLAADWSSAAGLPVDPTGSGRCQM